MKHSIKITIILLILFLIAQFIGLATLSKYLPFPEPTQTTFSFLPIIFAILVGTLLFFILNKFKLIWVIKIWFLLAISIALTLTFGAYLPAIIALPLSLVLSFWRIFKPNFWIQNGTELFIYAGLSVIIVPLLNLTSAILLLILISIYDAYAVWKSKHMIKLAKSQAKAKVFAGLLISYQIKKLKSSSKIKKYNSTKTTKPAKNIRTAILGGGDIGFPLFFAGVILKEIGLWQSLIIPFFAAGGLAFLFWKAKEKKFYPAMPFITVGCFLGVVTIYLITIL